MVKEIEGITYKEARIHANICGDGCLYICLCKRPPSDLQNHRRKNIYRNFYCIKYSNNEISLLNRFADDVKSVYGLKSYLSRNEHLIKAKWVYDRLKYLGAGKSKEWFIGKEIFDADNNVIKEWLMAFFDDEGHVDIANNYLTLNSVNLDGLKQIKLLLNKVGIVNITVKGPYYYKGFFSYRLKVLSKDLHKFNELVGFSHPKKVRELQELISKRNKMEKTN